MEILKSIESGEISTHDGISMMNKKDEEIDVDIDTSSDLLPSQDELNEHEKWWRIPWIIGLTIFIGTGMGMNSIAMNYGFNFWFFLMLIPLFAGTFLLVLTWPSDDRPWVHIFVKNTGRHNNKVKISIPLPVTFTSWIFKFGLKFVPMNFKNNFDEETIDLIFQELKDGKRTGNPLHVHVNDNESEIVDIYIG